MNIKHKLATLVILSVLLEGCSNSGTPANDHSGSAKTGAKSPASVAIKTWDKLPGFVDCLIDGSGKLIRTKSDDKDLRLAINANTKYILEKGETRIAVLGVDNGFEFEIKGDPADSLSVKELYLSKGSKFKTDAAKVVLGTVTLPTGSNFSKEAHRVVDFEGVDQGAWKSPRVFKSHSIHGVFEPDFIVRKGYSLNASGTFGGNLTNEGNFVLKQGLIPDVKGTFVNKGTITVTLTDKVADWSKSLVAKAITLGGSLRVSGGEKDGIYKLFSSADGITGKFDKIKGASVEGFKDTDKNFSVKASGIFLKPISVPHSGISLSHAVSSSAHSVSFIESAFSGIEMHSAEKTSLGYGMSVTSLSQGQEKFFGFSAGNIGLYVNYENLNNMDFGAYAVSSIGELKMLNSVAFAVGDKFSDAHSAGEVKKNFFQISSELGKTFAVENFKITPKVMASVSDFLSLEGNLQIGDDAFFIDGKSKASFSAGIGMDLASNFKVAAIPVEAFASFGLTNATGHGITMTNGDQVVTSASGISASCKFGFNAQVSQDSKFYSNVNLTSDENSSLELGFKIKM